jgi:phosphoenolpyruvate carboxykinase (GTP)
MGDYVQHWLAMGDRLGAKAPRVFYVNWFRKSAEGRFLWPGFSDNSRPLKWMCERVDGTVGARETPIGLMPKDGDLDLSGLDLAKDNMQALLDVDLKEWKTEVPDIEKHFALFGNRMPARLKKQLEEMKKRLG